MRSAAPDVPFDVPPDWALPLFASPPTAADDARSPAGGDEAAEAPEVPSMQHPLMGVVAQDDVSSEDLEACRQAAALEIVAGIERAISAVHPSDVAERAWFLARLRETRAMAGLAPLELAGMSRVLPGVRSA